MQQKSDPYQLRTRRAQVRLLLKEGAKPNVTTELQETPLHEAASSREPMAGMAGGILASLT
jgi:ankyrin repeat protein